MESVLDSVQDALEDLKKGKVVIVVDDEHRENEGDLICASECITPGVVNFMLKEARGLMCIRLCRCSSPANIAEQRAISLCRETASPCSC